MLVVRGGAALPHVVCGRGVLDEREGEGRKNPSDSGSTFHGTQHVSSGICIIQWTGRYPGPRAWGRADQACGFGSGFRNFTSPDTGGTDELLCSAIRCYGFEEDYMDVGGIAQKALKHKRSASSSQAVSDPAVLPYCIGNKAGGQIVDKTTWHQLSQ